MSLPKHAAFGSRLDNLQQYFTDRDRLEQPPAMADAEEAELLLKLKTAPATLKIYNIPNLRLRVVAYRIVWYGWAMDSMGLSLTRVLPAGDAALENYLRSREAQNEAKATAQRRKFYPAPGEPRTHPAADDPKFRRLFTERDRMACPPDLPDDTEGQLLLVHIRDFMGTHSLAHATSLRNFKGSSPTVKNAAMRMQMWGWFGGTGWQSVGPMTGAGQQALKRWLTACGNAGDAKRADLRKHLFPTEAEIRRHEEREVRISELRQRRNEINRDIGQCNRDINELTAEINRCGMEIAKGANDVDGLIEVMRRTYDTLAAKQRERGSLQGTVGEVDGQLRDLGVQPYT